MNEANEIHSVRQKTENPSNIAIASVWIGGQVPRHHEPSFRPHARSVAQFTVHERFVALGSHYPHLRTRLGFSA